ncbi:IclR family transcriptional regulator [Defluviimonas sp. WL0002]|uniref:IclR family transcriptional regulator n=1 Tax=Albidovulum marisflavi TaxID=2984159 RepID=A0ABT2ZDQ7_9RHOB|nr:IclR family transcriptional regulator [Defluviimonas sp. WL0002]MCV2869270.1 IclR family transcriptional regulator [Defluviimonas sp. WL0002]
MAFVEELIMGTITNALELLSLFSRVRPSLGLGDLVRLSGRDKATVHRYLVELTQNGFLQQNPNTRTYCLGPAILRLAAVREATAPVRSMVMPIIEALAEETGELVHFSLLHGTKLSPVCHVDPRRHGTQVHFDEADMLPLHATASGVAVLAFGTDALRQQVLRGELHAYADNTVTRPEALCALIERAAQTGMGEVSKAFDNEVASRAMPIFDAEGSVAGALAVAMPLARMTEQKKRETAKSLREGMKKVTRAIGGVVPEHYAALARQAAE